MIKLFNKTTNEFIGRISEADLEFLREQLEEESLHDRDYFLRKETIDGFRTAGASTRLLEVLQGGLRSGDTIEIRWETDQSASA